MLEVHDVRFVGSTSDPDWHPDPPRPEIAFVGRSNVGKSSLLNTLCRRKKLAHTSKTPGKTRTLNYFDVDGTCYFVDLPGYGYAKRPMAERERWGPMMEAYLSGNARLAGVVSLIDSRHPPTRLDQRMVEYLASQEIPTLVVLTKADKVGRGQRADRLGRMTERLGVDPDQMVWFSSLSGEGRDEIFTAISHLVESEAA
ncbi:MAG: ribosome biogenesis GTP-binding protein YihA/YsxC [Gemmatimonadetes bacterium]|nr:ribosome biogenesis GTP-binding protein YihA/YsxC [Gemmatimonadota bacterium]